MEPKNQEEGYYTREYRVIRHLLITLITQHILMQYHLVVDVDIDEQYYLPIPEKLLDINRMYEKPRTIHKVINSDIELVDYIINLLFDYEYQSKPSKMVRDKKHKKPQINDQEMIGRVIKEMKTRKIKKVATVTKDIIRNSGEFCLDEDERIHNVPAQNTSISLESYEDRICRKVRKAITEIKNDTIDYSFLYENPDFDSTFPSLKEMQKKADLENFDLMRPFLRKYKKGIINLLDKL